MLRTHTLTHTLTDFGALKSDASYTELTCTLTFVLPSTIPAWANFLTSIPVPSHSNIPAANLNSCIPVLTFPSLCSPLWKLWTEKSPHTRINRHSMPLSGCPWTPISLVLTVREPCGEEAEELCIRPRESPALPPTNKAASWAQGSYL